MLKEIYKMLLICISSFFISKDWWLVESGWKNQESMKMIGLAKNRLHGNKTRVDPGRMKIAAIIGGSTLGIGMIALPDESLSSEINSQDQLNTSTISEVMNKQAAFGMHNGAESSITAKADAAQDRETEENPYDDTAEESSIVDELARLTVDSGSVSKWISSTNFEQFDNPGSDPDFDQNENLSNSESDLADVNCSLVAENPQCDADYLYECQNQSFQQFGMGLSKPIIGSTNINGNGIDFDQNVYLCNSKSALVNMYDDLDEWQSKQPQQFGMELTEPMIESTDFDGNDMINKKSKALGGTDDGNYSQMPRGIQSKSMVTKKRKLKICVAVVGSLLVLGVVITMIVLKALTINKETPIEILNGPNHTTTMPTAETIDTKSGKIDQTQRMPTSETIDTTSRKIDQMQQIIDKMQQTIDNMTEKCRIDVEPQAGVALTDKNSVDYNINLPIDICRAYKNTRRVCTEFQPFAEAMCKIGVLTCLNENRSVTDASFPKCSNNYVNEVSFGQYIFEKFKGILNRGIQSVGKISRLNCTAAFNGFDRDVSEMASLYKCDSLLDFQTNVLKTSLSTCNALRNGNLSVAQFCLAQKNIEPFERLKLLTIDLIGAMGEDIQKKFHTCSGKYDPEYLEAFIP